MEFVISDAELAKYEHTPSQSTISKEFLDQWNYKFRFYKCLINHLQLFHQLSVLGICISTF